MKSSKSSLYQEKITAMSGDALNQQVEAGLNSGALAIASAGLALKEIQRRGDYPTTFEDYVKQHFELTRGRAYQLIYAAEIIADLSDVFEANQLPRSESAVRPMIALTKEQRIKVWERAMTGRRRSPGRGVVEEIVQEMYGAAS